jgi:hypothetical protein
MSPELAYRERDMIEINLAEAKRLAEEQVTLMGENYVYPYHLCVNATHGGTMSHFDTKDSTRFIKPTALCIVGRILESAGVPLDTLIHAVGVASTTIEYLNCSDILRATPAAIEYLQALQSFQDGRETWGTSLKFADMMRIVGTDLTFP